MISDGHPYPFFPPEVPLPPGREMAPQTMKYQSQAQRNKGNATSRFRFSYLQLIGHNPSDMFLL